MRCSSAAQLPRSMSLQRSEQKGRFRFFDVHFTALLQVGQLTIRGVVIASLKPHVANLPVDKDAADHHY
jgi:hypothetical protein